MKRRSNLTHMGTLLLAALALAASAGCAPPKADLPATMTAAAAHATTAPATEVPPPTDTPSAPVTPIPVASFNGVQVALDPALARGISGQLEPASSATSDAEPWSAHPAYTKLELVGYDSQNAYFRPLIAVYPVAGLEAIPQAAPIVRQLRDLLAARPATPEGAIPFLPMVNAAQSFRAQVQYLRFQSGTGVRFLTQYGQAILPINNQELFYTFQGLTTDGAYYVSAILPVAAPFLPADWNPETAPPEGGLPFPAWTESGFEAQALAYLEAMTAKIDGTPGTVFTPDLAALDALMASLQVSAP